MLVEDFSAIKRELDRVRKEKAEMVAGEPEKPVERKLHRGVIHGRTTSRLPKMALSQNDLDWFAARLAIAIYDTNRENPEMSIASLKAALADIEGFEHLTISHAANGNQVISIGDKHVEVGPMASNDEIKAAFQHPLVPTLNTKVTVNPIDRLKEKLAKAAGVGGRVAAKIEAKADALIAREGQLDTKADQAFAGHEAIADAANSQLDEVEAALNQLSNGGPPLNG